MDDLPAAEIDPELWNFQMAFGATREFFLHVRSSSIKVVVYSFTRLTCLLQVGSAVTLGVA